MMPNIVNFLMNLTAEQENIVLLSTLSLTSKQPGKTCLLLVYFLLQQRASLTADVHDTRTMIS